MGQKRGSTEENNYNLQQTKLTEVMLTTKENDIIMQKKTNKSRIQQGLGKGEQYKIRVGTWNIKSRFEEGQLRRLIGETRKYNGYNDTTETKHKGKVVIVVEGHVVFDSLVENIIECQEQDLFEQFKK